ncbi:MAG TPA: hypothetical protein VNQ99_12235 [Xanthobacteraceae bacterium]|nr:hypothetical protein [Xanthobacteraceae bacterium]
MLRFSQPSGGAAISLSYFLRGPVGADGPAGATGAGVATGGAAGTILRKQTSSDYETAWDTVDNVVGAANVTPSDESTSIALKDVAALGKFAVNDGTVRRSNEQRWSDEIRASDYDVVDDSITDNQLRISNMCAKAALLGKKSLVFDLPGSIRVASPGAFPVFRQDHTQIRGTGTTYFLIDSNDQGDFLNFSPEENQHNVGAIDLRDFNIYATADTNTGRALVLHDVFAAKVHNVGLYAHYACMTLIGGGGHEFTQFQMASDAAFAEYRANSYLLKIEKSPFRAGGTLGGIIPSEIHFGLSEWRGQQINGRLSKNIWITCADGIWWESGGHFGMCRDEIILIDPAKAFDGEAQDHQITAIYMDGVYLDSCPLGTGLKITQPEDYNGVAGALSFDFRFVNDCKIGADLGIDQIALSKLNIDGTNGTERPVILRSNAGAGSWEVNLRDAISLNENNDGSGGVDVLEDYSHARIMTLRVRKGPGVAPEFGLRVASGAQDIQVFDPEFEGCTADILDSSGGQLTVFESSEWTRTWTPTLSVGSGTPGTLTVAAARYKKIGKWVTVHLEIDSASVGTASGYLMATLPFTPKNGTFSRNGIEVRVTGASLRALLVGGDNKAYITRDDTSYPFSGDDQLAYMDITYEIE